MQLAAFTYRLNTGVGVRKRGAKDDSEDFGLSYQKSSYDQLKTMNNSLEKWATI